MAEPEPIAVVAKDTQSGSGSVAENEESSTERISIEHLAADARQTINAFTKVYRLCACKDAHLRADLNHRVWLTNELTKSDS